MSPARNQDGSSENVDLESARVMRRVKDVPAPPPAPAAAESPRDHPEAASVPPATPPGATPTVTPPAATPTVTAPAATPTVTPPGATPTVGAPGATPTATPPAAPPPFHSEAVVVAEVVSLKLGEKQDHEEPIDPAWIGKRVEYAIVYVNGKGRESPLTGIVSIDPVAALPRPGTPKAVADDGFVALSWSPLPEAPASIAFAVYRRLEEAMEYPETPLNPEPLVTPGFEDRTAVFGAGSCYVVAAVLPPPGFIASDPSEEICITPEDRFAPEAPSGLLAVPSSDAVLLSWRDADAPDRKGYRVYRGASPEGPFELVAEVTESSYADGSAALGETYFYAVTAIDDAPGINESARTEVAEARRSP